MPEKCGKGWHHSIVDPCSELDPYFLQCPGCMSADVVGELIKREGRKKMKTADEDGVEAGALLRDIARVLPPDDVPGEIGLPELIESYLSRRA
jgi:hypothetical protein